MGGGYSVSADELIEDLVSSYKAGKDMKTVIVEVREKASKLDKNEDRERVEKAIAQYESRDESRDESMTVPAETTKKQKSLRKDSYTFTVNLVNQVTRLEEDVTFDIPEASILNQPEESKQYLPDILQCLQQGNICGKVKQEEVYMCIDVYGDNLTVNYCTNNSEKYKANMLVRSELPEKFMTTIFLPSYFAITVDDATINRTQKGSVTFFVEKQQYMEDKVRVIENVDDLVSLVKTGEIDSEQTALNNILRIISELIVFVMMLIANKIIAVVVIEKIFFAQFLFAAVDIRKAMRIGNTGDETFPIDVEGFFDKTIEIIQQLIQNFEDSEECEVNADFVIQQFEEAGVFEGLEDDKKDAVYEQIVVCLESLCIIIKKFFSDSKPEVRASIKEEILPKVLSNLNRKSREVAVQQNGSYTKIVSPENQEQEKIDAFEETGEQPSFDEMGEMETFEQ